MTPGPHFSMHLRTIMHLFDTDSGYFISEDHRRIAELINEWDSTIELLWIPPDQRIGETHPFALRHSPANRPPYIIAKLREDEVNADIIAWLWSNDTERQDVVARMEKREAATIALKAKQELEQHEERTEIASSILNSPLNVYRHNGVTYRG